MIKLVEEIKTKITNKFNPDQLEVIDNSHFHTRHKSFDSNKFHLKIIIKSQALKKMSQIEAHKAIFATLKDEMQSKIHALEIEIK